MTVTAARTAAAGGAEGRDARLADSEVVHVRPVVGSDAAVLRGCTMPPWTTASTCITSARPDPGSEPPTGHDHVRDTGA